MRQRYRPQANECFEWEPDTDGDEDDVEPEQGGEEAQDEVQE